MFFGPNTGLFTGDGAPRKSPYRADGTLPSKPDLESDFLTKKQYPEPAEDQLHLLSTREYSKRMADFGKKGPVQRFSVPRPMTQGNQQGTRVMVQRAGEGSVLGRRVHLGDDVEGEGSVLSRRVPAADKMEGKSSTPARHINTLDDTAAETARMRRTRWGPSGGDPSAAEEEEMEKSSDDAEIVV